MEQQLETLQVYVIERVGALYCFGGSLRFLWSWRLVWPHAAQHEVEALEAQLQALQVRG
jgi:hypothetical protein